VNASSIVKKAKLTYLDALASRSSLHVVDQSSVSGANTEGKTKSGKMRIGVPYQQSEPRSDRP